MKKSMYTSINSDKLPRAHKLLENRTVRALIGEITIGSSVIFDHGCGRYIDHIKEHAYRLRYFYFGWDEYWNKEVPEVMTYDMMQSLMENRTAGLKAVHISSNVMNVITDDWELQTYCQRVYDLMNVGEHLILTVYEADAPSETQRAEPLELYVEKLESYFGLITERQTKGYAVMRKE